MDRLDGQWADATAGPDRQRWSRITYGRAALLTSMASITVTTYLTISLFPPFFPRVAEQRGFGTAIYGAVIGVNCLVALLLAPLVGNQLGSLGSRVCLAGGVALSGLGCVLCGLLDSVPAGVGFVAAAFVFRVTQAVGMTSVVVATLTYSNRLVATGSGTVFALQRAAAGLAQLLGPPLGGLLYQLRGFYLPFVVFGALHVLNTVPLLWLLSEDRSEMDQSASGTDLLEGKPPSNPFISNPSTSPKMLFDTTLQDSEKEEGEEGDIKHKPEIQDVPRVGQFRRLLGVPAARVALSSFVVCGMSTGLLSVTLETRVLRRYHLPHGALGLLFGLRDGASCVSSPVWGLLCDWTSTGGLRVCLVLASLTAAGCFGVFGLADQPSLPAVVTALCLYGVAVSGITVASMVWALQEARQGRLPDADGLVTGLWSSLSAAGRFTARLAGGLLVDTAGFPQTCFVLVMLHLAVAGLATFVTGPSQPPRYTPLPDQPAETAQREASASRSV